LYGGHEDLPVLQESFMSQEYDLLQRAVRYLTSRCDYAHNLDGTGFNGVDAGFGHEMAEKEDWTPKMAHAVWKMIS
jgi:hypothetical protein